MRELKFDIIFWDGFDHKTIEHVLLQQAISEDYVIFDDNIMKPFDECTIIREYTGLKDKNGKEIYESDVVKMGEYICQVIWDKHFASFCLSRNGWMYDHFFGEAIAIFDDKADCEVIGNIYENSDLLKESKQCRSQ
jgi:uncharacterized phage protein (TIGR01671 family)